MKLTNEQLKRIIKEELNSIEEQEERSEGNIQQMREKAIELINKMSVDTLVKLLTQFNPETRQVIKNML